MMIIVELMSTIAFGTAVFNNSVCYCVEIHTGKKRQHLMSIFVAACSCSCGMLTLTGISPSYYNVNAGITYGPELPHSSAFPSTPRSRTLSHTCSCAAPL
jgi:hypothetical protein